MNPDTTAAVARIRQRLDQLRTAAQSARDHVKAATAERDEAIHARWRHQREAASNRRAAEGFEEMQQRLAVAQQRESELRDGLRAVLKDLTALSRYLQP